MNFFRLLRYCLPNVHYKSILVFLYSDSNIDKGVIISAVKELKWEFVSSNQKYIIIKAGTWQRQISIVFDNKDILIHSLRFGQDDFYFTETSRLDLLLDKIKEIENHNIKLS